MGNKLFGIDIAKIIDKNISKGVLPAVLTRLSDQEKAADAPLLAPPTKTPKEYGCRGFTDDFKIEQIDGIQIQEDDRKIVLIGDSIEGGIIPAKGDTIFIESTLFQVLSILERDPAAATYTIHVRR